MKNNEGKGTMVMTIKIIKMTMKTLNKDDILQN